MRKTSYQWVRVVTIFCDQCGQPIKGNHTVVETPEADKPELDFHSDYQDDVNYTCYQQWQIRQFLRRFMEREKLGADELLVLSDAQFDPQQPRPFWNKIHLTHFILPETNSMAIPNIVYINSDCRLKWLSKAGVLQPTGQDKKVARNIRSKAAT